MQYDSQGFTKATVVMLEGAGHGPQYYNDNTVRGVFADFLAHTGESVSEWESLKACKQETNGIYTCPTDGPDTCKTVDGKYQVNPDATCKVGAMPFADVVDTASIKKSMAGLEGWTWQSSPQSCMLMGAFLLVAALSALAFQSSRRVQLPQGTELLEAISQEE